MRERKVKDDSKIFVRPMEERTVHSLDREDNGRSRFEMVAVKIKRSVLHVLSLSCLLKVGVEM